jgi:hypothetical protein
MGSQGPWRMSKTKSLHYALSNEYFKGLGLQNFAARKVLNPPNRRMRTRTYGGVAGRTREGSPYANWRRIDSSKTHH